MIIFRIRRNRIRRNERGAVLMVIALSMTAVVGTTGLIVDGSSAFAQRRQMQNAADSAALAGARALDRVVVHAEGAIWNAVVASATANGANPADITCRLMTDLLSDLGACPTAGTGGALNLRNTASAVKVTVGQTKDTAFIQAVGVDEFTAHAKATAQIQGLRGGSSPFALCAVGDSDPRALGDGQNTAILLPDNTINPLAVGVQYMLQDSSQPITCGQGNEFKGLLDALDGNRPVPGPFDLENGTLGSNVSGAVVVGNEACGAALATGCVIGVPLCHAMDPPVMMKFYCQRFAPFRIVDLPSQSQIGGILIDGVHATGGQGGGHAQPGEIRVIKLSE